MNHLKDKFKNCFSLSKNSKLIRIKVDGEFVSINGKSVWHGIGAAKNALSNHCRRGWLCRVILEDRDLPLYGFHRKNEVYQEFLDWALETKFLEFVESVDD